MLLILLISGCLSLVLPAIRGQDSNLITESVACETACERTYPLHTYPSADHLESCKRGCRFSTLINFMQEHSATNNVKDLCLAACKEAYNQTFEQYACNVGCNNQETTIIKPTENNRTFDLMFHVQSVFERMSGFVSSSWVLYISDDQTGENSVIAAAANSIISEDKDEDNSSDLGGSWWSYQRTESSDWFPSSGISTSCFYDFLHFLFFKIIVLFLIFVFILTILTLLHITLYDMTKRQQGYVSYIESAHYDISEPCVTKLGV